MDQWLSVVTAVLGFITGGGYSRLTAPGRLVSSIAAQQDILAKMPNGHVRDRLCDHVDRQVLRLVAHQGEPDSEERDRLRSAWGWLGLAVIFGGNFIVNGRQAEEPALTLWFAGVLFCTIQGGKRLSEWRQARTQRLRLGASPTPPSC